MSRAAAIRAADSSRQLDCKGGAGNCVCVCVCVCVWRCVGKIGKKGKLAIRRL